MKSVTLKDVARAAGVSYSTVSRALSDSPQIGRETRERILRLCDEMVAIPQVGNIGSLNVSVAAGVMMYEVVRQRMSEV